MKLKVLALGAAVASISCVTPCSAQLHIESPAGSYPESRVAFQNSEVGLDVFGQAPSADAASSDSSDYFAQGAPGDGLGQPKSILTEQPSAFTSTPPSTSPSSPPSMPPSVAQSPAPAQAPLGVLAGTPEVGMVPVCWPDAAGGCPTPNPIADMMMRNWCTDGLWATYPAQRARHCERIQHHTGGYNRYTHACSTCAGVQHAHAWPAEHCASSTNTETAALLAGVPEVPQKPVAQLVISPVMSAPAQLPTAKVAPAQPEPQRSAAAPEAAPTAHPESPVPQFPSTPNPLPADSMPTDIPIVATRSAGFLR